MLKRRLLLLTPTLSILAPAAMRAAKRVKAAPAPAVTGSPAETPVGPVDTAAKWAFITDFNTGAVLLDKDADEPMPPSSMTKLMTAYIVYGMLKSGRLKLDQELPVSEKAWRMQGSKMFVPLGESVKVEDLIRGMIVQSGNDACIVLAEGIAGSEDAFVELMNQKAKEMGLTRHAFRQLHGMARSRSARVVPGSGDDRQAADRRLSRSITGSIARNRSSTTTSRRRTGTRWCRRASPTASRPGTRRRAASGWSPARNGAGGG